MAYIVTSRSPAGQFRQKYSTREAAIQKFEHLFGGRIESAIAAHYENAEDPPTRATVQAVAARSEQGASVTFNERA